MAYHLSPNLAWITADPIRLCCEKMLNCKWNQNIFIQGGILFEIYIYKWPKQGTKSQYAEDPLSWSGSPMAAVYHSHALKDPNIIPCSTGPPAGVHHTHSGGQGVGVGLGEVSSGAGPTPSLDIKAIFSSYGDSHVKDKTVVRWSYL